MPPAGKKRVYEIARERGLQTQQVMRRLHAAGVEVKAAASTVDEADIERVFGAKKPAVSPATGGALPSWLTASQVPKTTTREELAKKEAAASAKADAAKAAKQKAVEQAKRLRAQAAEKRAAEQHAAEQAKANAEAQATSGREAVAPAPVDDVPVAQEASAPVDVDAPVDTDDAVEAVIDAADDAASADEPATAPKLRGPKIISRAAEPEPEPAPASEASADADGADESQLSETELRRRAQKLAQQRAAELASRRRAQLEAEKLEAERAAKAGEKAAKKKDKKKGTATEGESSEEFVGSRQPRVGSRDPNLADSERGGRRGPSRRRRVVIDAQASRRGGPGGGKRQGGKRDRRDRNTTVEIDPTVPVTIHAGATVAELATALGVGATEIIKVMMAGGDFVTITQSLSTEQIELVGIGLEPPREIVIRSAADDEELPEFEDAPESLVTRAPVVTIMGHVDHGKTSLLDAIRSTKVTETEAGGITQHIGAYQVSMPDGRSVTFLDTPGHEAFTALRARGAKVTDEAVLVVAADDGVKPQTIEAIDHARAAEVPILVAINKIDKENASPDKVKAELAQHDLQPSEWGGDTTMVEVSAKQRLNLDELIEMILLQADVLELKANPDTEASGYIIESKLDPGRGPVCTMLVSRGTLKVGDAILAGASWGKVRALQDFRGHRVKEAGPAMPVEIVGFSDVPTSGEFCYVVDNERIAREKAQKRAQRLRAEQLAKRQRGLTLDDLFNRIKEGEVQDLNLVVKADVAGSIEAIEQELGKIQHSEVAVRIISTGVGAITANDINLATASSAIVLGFNVRPNAEARQVAEREGIDVRTYSIIYKLREDVENALSGLLSPEEVEETIGEAEVRQLFKASRVGTIAGCMVTHGHIDRNAKIRLVRNGAVVYGGELASLKRFKDDVRDVAQGFECALTIENFNDIKEGDVVEAYVVKEVERTFENQPEAAATA